MVHSLWPVMLLAAEEAVAFHHTTITTRCSPLHAAKDEGWSVADDWEALSSENPRNSAPDFSTIFNQDIAGNAAKSILPDNHGDDDSDSSEEEVWLNEIIEDIIQTPLSSTALYDTGLEHGRPQDQKAFEERMGDEIAMLVRCNESPQDMLVQAGRAVPVITLEQKRDVSQLLGWNEKGHWEQTPFFLQAIGTMFHTHATTANGEEQPTMDAKAVSRWMTQSIGAELESYTERSKKGKDMTATRQKKRVKIGPHDGRVLKLLSQYSTYGTGRLTLSNMEVLYLDALTRVSNNGMKLTGDLETIQLRNADHVRQVWRDLNNHRIISPNEQEWRKEKAKLEKEFGSLQQQTHKLLEQGHEFMDECEILDFGAYEPPPTAQQVESGHDAKNHKYIRKSSHEKVQLAPDGKTPLYMDEGDFVFIDEESCIGCMQCVNAAPSSYLMLEDGRARTFRQRQGSDAKQGVAACPVNCMHFVSFDELKELETVRDKGDGRDDHRHMGHRRGHTPLYVAGIGSDNNHRSSWYHHIKNKCCTSGQCPQRGCFDCPSYRVSGGNPYFQKHAKEGQHIRAQHFIDRGDADLWRKKAEL